MRHWVFRDAFRVANVLKSFLTLFHTHTRPQVVDVVDHWVFERRAHARVQNQQMDVKDGRWRLAGRLTVQDGGSY